MHHKRKRPKHQRAGCLMCKPWKDERVGGGDRASEIMKRPIGDMRKIQRDADDI